MAKITLELNVDAEKGTATLKQFAGDAEAATKKAGDAAKEGGKGFGQFATSLDETVDKIKGLLTPVNLLGAGIGYGLVEALRHAQEATIEYASELTRLKGVTGASIEELGGLREAADKMGVGSGQLQRALLLMSSQIEAGGEALGRMGISVEDVNGKQKAELTLLFEVIDKLSGMTNKTEAAALAKKTFGRAVGELLPLLLSGSERIKELGQSGADFAKEVGDEALVQIREFKGELSETGDAVSRMQITVMRDAIPALTVLAQTFVLVVDTARQIPTPLRYLLEIVTVLVAGLVSLALVVKTVGIAWGILTALPGVAWLGSIATAIGTVVAAMNPWIALLVGLGAIMYAAFTGQLDSIYDRFTSFLNSLGSKIKDFASGLWESFRIRGMTMPEAPGLSAADDARELRTAQERQRLAAESQVELERNLALRQKRLEIEKEILAETLKYYQATQAPEQAQISAIKANLALKLQELDIKKELRKDLAAEYDKEADEAKRAATAQTLAIQVTALKTIDAAKAASLQASIAATETDEAKVRDSAKAESDEIDRQLQIQRQSRSLSDKEIIEAEEKKKTVAVKMYEELRKLAVEHAAAMMAIANKETETDVALRKNEVNATVAGLDAEQVARQHALDTSQMSDAQFAAESIQNTNQIRDAKLAALDVQQAADELEAVRAIAQAEKKAAGIKGSEGQLAIDIATINADLNNKLAGLDGEREKATQESEAKKLQYQYNAEKIHESLVTEATGRDIAQHLAALDEEAKNAGDNADLLRVIDAKRFQDRKTLYDRAVQQAIDAWAEETHVYQSEADEQLAIAAGKFTLEKSLYDASVQNYINARLKETGYLQDALTKRLAEEAGYIQAVDQLRQKLIADAATVLTQQARLAGDLGAAFQVGFAEATTAAEDAYAAMKKAGADTYASLKSGASDFLYEIYSTSGKIGDVFTNLGKRLLRTMTDAFAEIAVKWAMTAAGFTLPTLLGTGTAVAGTAASTLLNGDALATTQAKLASLGDSATGAMSALAGVAEGGSVVSVVFAAITKTVGMFASGIVEVLQFIGSLVSGSGGSSILSSLSSGLSSVLSTLSSGLSSITSLFSGGLGSLFGSSGGAWSNAAGAMGSGAGSFGSIGALSQGMQFIMQAAPWIGAAYGLYQMFSGNLSPMSGAIQGAAIGTMVLPGVGTVIGGIVGTIAGFLSGLFGGPTPEISGKTVLKPTDIAGVLGAKPAVHWGENGPTVVNPPGRSQFSYLQSGPFYEEMYYHRSEGQLSREQSQISIMNVILGTLQAAVKSAAALIPQMPTADLSKALSDRLHAVLAAGFEITNFDVEGGDAVKKFGDYLKALSAKTLEVFSKQLFPTIDLKALGGGDVIKGWDALASAMGAMGSVIKAVAKDANLSSVTLNDFAERSVAYFRQFAKEGEAFPDTVKRISTAIAGILDIQNQVAERQRALTGDIVGSITAQGTALMAMINNIGSLADALHVAVESNASPEDVLKAAQSLLQAYDAAIQMAQQLKAQIDTLNAAIVAGVGFAVELTQKIDALRGTVADPAFMQAAIDGIVTLFNAITDVTARISLFASGLLLLSESAGGILGNIPLVVEGFNLIMAQISQMANPSDAIAALKGLAQAVEQGLAAAIQATQAHYAKLRQAAQDEANAQIAALEAQKTAVQKHYQDQITALTDLQNQATALDSTLKSLRSSIQSATQFFDSLTATIAKLSNTYSGGAAFDAALNSVAQRIEQLRGLTNAQDALSGLQSLAQDIQTALQAAIQEVQQHFADLKQAAQDASQARIAAMQDERTALQQHYADLKTAAQDAANARVTALQDEKTAIQTAFEARKTALQTELDLSKQWGTILSSVKAMQVDLFNTLANTHPVTSLNEVRSQLVSAFAQFQATHTPEAATAVQDLAKQVLDLAKQTPGYELPTANFQALATQIQSMLGTISGTAGSQRDPAAIQQQIADLTQQENDTLKSIDDQIKAVNTDLQSTLTALSRDETNGLKQIDDRIAAENQHLKDTLKELSRQEQVQVAALNARAVTALTAIQHEVQERIVALQAQEAEAAAKLRAILGDRTIEQFTADTTAQIKALQEKQAAELAAIDAKIAAVNANLQATLTTLSQQEQAEIRSLQNLAAAGLEAIRAQLIIQISALADQQARASAALQAILGDKTYEQFIAEKQRQATELLHGIDDTLQHYLSKILDKIAPGTETPSEAKLQEVSANLLTLAELAQGGNLPTLAQSLAVASVSAKAGDAAATLSALSSSVQIMDAMSWFHSGIGGDIFRQFQDLTSLVSQGQYLSAIQSVATLLHMVEDAGIVTLAHVPGFAEGTDFVPNTGLAMLHRGERVLTAAENRAYSNGSSGETTITVHFAPTVAVTMTGTESPQRVKRIIDEAVASLLSGPSRTRAELVRFAREHR